MPSESGRETFIPRLSHWISFSIVALFFTAKGTVYAHCGPEMNVSMRIGRATADSSSRLEPGPIKPGPIEPGPIEPVRLEPGRAKTV